MSIDVRYEMMQWCLRSVSDDPKWSYLVKRSTQEVAEVEQGHGQVIINVNDGGANAKQPIANNHQELAPKQVDRPSGTQGKRKRGT